MVIFRKEKLTAIFLSFFLIFFDSYSLVASVGSAPLISTRSLHTATDPSDIVIPAQFGRIEESAGDSFEKTVIYIQDAHDSLEAQENIARLINYLVSRYGVQTVLEEGYEGPVPTDKHFRFIEDRDVKEKVSYFFMDKLRIGGAEYAHINRRKDFKLIGADNLKLYLDNIRFYQDASGDRERITKDLADLRREIETLAGRYFPRELKKWIKLKGRMDKGQLNLLDYLKQMPFDTSNYSNIAALLSAESTKDPAANKRLKNIDPKLLYEEMERIESEFTDSFLKSERDKRIFQYYKYIKLLERLNAIKLSAAEYEAVKSFLQSVKTRELASFIARYARKSVVFSKRWETAIQSAVSFYETAHARDDTIKARLEDFKMGDEKIAILVFGGFHKDRIRQILNQNFSYEMIVPRMTKLDARHQSYYEQLMTAGHLPFEALSQGRNAARPRSIISMPPQIALSEIRAVYKGIHLFPDGGSGLESYLLQGQQENLKLHSQARSEARMNPRLEKEIRQMREALDNDKTWKENLLEILDKKILGPKRVYYPAAGADLINPILNVDADILIAVDYMQAGEIFPYVKQVLNNANVHHFAIEKTDTKYTVRFYYNGKERVVHYYFGVDAGREDQLPLEVTAGFEIYYESLLTYNYAGRSGILEKDETPAALKKALKYLRPGGFVYSDYNAAEQLPTSGLHFLKYLVSYFAPKGRKIPAVLLPPKEPSEFSFTQLNRFIRENSVSVLLVYWPLAVLAASSLYIASKFMQEPMLRWTAQTLAGISAVAGQYLFFYSIGTAFKSLFSRSKQEKTSPPAAGSEKDVPKDSDSDSGRQTSRSEMRSAEPAKQTITYLKSDTAVINREARAGLNRSIIFIDGAAQYGQVRARAEELAVLATRDRTRTLVIYNIEKNMTAPRGQSKLWNLLKSFDLPNIRFVAGPLVEVVKPYYDHTDLDLVQYSAEENDAISTIAQTGNYRERLIYFVGKPGALGYGLRNLEAVKLSKSVEDIISQNGYHMIANRASAWIRLVQEAQFVTVFAQAA